MEFGVGIRIFYKRYIEDIRKIPRKPDMYSFWARNVRDFQECNL